MSLPPSTPALVGCSHPRWRSTNKPGGEGSTNQRAKENALPNIEDHLQVRQNKKIWAGWKVQHDEETRNIRTKTTECGKIAKDSKNKNEDTTLGVIQLVEKSAKKSHRRWLRGTDRETGHWKQKQHGKTCEDHKKKPQSQGGVLNLKWKKDDKQTAHETVSCAVFY